MAPQMAQRGANLLGGYLYEQLVGYLKQHLLELLNVRFGQVDLTPARQSHDGHDAFDILRARVETLHGGIIVHSPRISLLESPLGASRIGRRA
jgi:hypothetical protein